MIYLDTGTSGYNYASGVDNTISRLTSMTNSSITLEGLAYLGLGTVVERTHPQPDLKLTYIGSGTGEGGDRYLDLDRFGRIIDQRWVVTSTDVDRNKYGYDRNSNRLYRTNEANHSFDELYHADGASNGYDGLNQLAEFQRGTLSDTNSDSIPDTVSSAARYQTWDLDAVGNFDGVNTDGTNQSRTHNKQNQSTVVGGNNLTFDANGNMTTDETGRTITFDAWNRLIKINNTTRYANDALGRRIKEGSIDLYHSTSWQVLEEYNGGDPVNRYVWSPVYVDAMVLRDRDLDPRNVGFEERLYVTHDANFNVTSVITSGGTIAERFVYDPYGRFDFKDASYGTRASSSYAWVYLHQGGRFDATAGLFNFRNRDYSPTLMRWASVDPIGFGARDWNLYRSLFNRPVAHTDPFGLAPPAGLQPASPVRTNDPITADVGSANGGLAITGPQDALIRELQDKLCCCPADKRQMAMDLLRTLIELSNFHWPHPTGFFGDCGGWMDRYWDQLDSGMFRGMTLRSALAGVQECIKVERVTWDNPLGTAGCILGLGIVGALTIGTGLGLWGGAAYFAGGFAGGGAVGSIGGGFYGNNAAHNAIKITIVCDGKVFYLDDGNYGGATHVFYGLPPWFVNPREPPWADK